LSQDVSRTQQAALHLPIVADPTAASGLHKFLKHLLKDSNSEGNGERRINERGEEQDISARRLKKFAGCQCAATCASDCSIAKKRKESEKNLD